MSLFWCSLTAQCCLDFNYVNRLWRSSQSILVRIHHTLSFLLLIQIFIDLPLLDREGLRFPCRDHGIDLGIRILGFVNLSLFIA